MRILVAGIALALLAAGCGGSVETGPPLDAATRFVAAVARSDGAAACSLLAPEAVRRIDELRPEGCAGALPTLSLSTDPPGEVQVWAETSRVRSSADTLFLREFPTGWLVIGAGCTARQDRPYRCKVDGS